MNCNSMRGHVAPHKPILILSILEMFDKGKIAFNQIRPDETLVRVFMDTWNKYVEQDSPYNCVLSTPFYHMGHEPFWVLIPSEEYEKRTEYSINLLRKCFRYAVLDDELFALLQSKMCRQQIKDAIVGFYFYGEHPAVQPVNSTSTKIKEIVHSDENTPTTMSNVKLDPNSFFDKLLIDRKLEVCPLPLWNLKLRDDEYVELKKLLVKASMDRLYTFDKVTRECTLFFAQFWRREYAGGSHSIQMVWEALNSSSEINGIQTEFYNAAQKGAKKLGIEIFIGDTGRQDPLNSILYQGGLPMNYISTEGTKVTSIWNRFLRSLVNRRIDFDELNLGVVATKGNSMREFCNKLMDAVEKDQYMLMPFYCHDEFDSWFVYLKELAKQERTRRHQSRPFSIGWDFRVDEIEHKIYVKYTVNGQQRLAADFLENNGLKNLAFFSVQVRVNGKAVDTFDYANNFCRYSVVSKHSYNIGDEVSLFIHTNGEPWVTGNLDLSSPILLYMEKDGSFEKGNQIGRLKSLLIIPESWEVEEAEQYNIDDYSINGTPIKCVVIPEDFSGEIVTRSADGTITFGENDNIYWTELASPQLDEPDIIEPIYDAEKSKFKLCSDRDDFKRPAHSYDVLFRDKWQSEWHEKPSYGEIFATVKDKDGHYVSPVKMINVGNGLSVVLKEADKDSCQIKVSWPHGHVSTNSGTLKADNTWYIRKADCPDKQRICFSFVPADNPLGQFNLSVKAPYKDFSILDLEGNPIQSDCWIPYTDVDKYQYHIAGQDIKSYTFGNVTREIKRYNGKFYIVELGNRLKEISYSGSLLTLFDSREVLRSLLERTSNNFLDACVGVSFTTSEGKTLRFAIKDSPYRAIQTEDGKVIITGCNREQIPYKGTLNLFSLDNPGLDAIPLQYDEENGYVLPEEIRAWGKTLLTGRTRGRLCPSMVDITHTIDKEYRKKSREEAVETIKSELSSAKLDDEFWKRAIGWFKRVQNEDIPASSLLELSMIAEDADALLCLAFQLFVQCNNIDEIYTLTEQLKSMSKDLAFQWYWLQPKLNGIMFTLMPYLQDLHHPLIKNVIFMKWALQYNNGEALSAYILNPDSYDKFVGQCLMDVLDNFTKWMKTLCESSLLEQYGNNLSDSSQKTAHALIFKDQPLYNIVDENERYYEIRQDFIDSSIDAFFAAFIEPGKKGNEQWMYTRANAVAAHIKGNVNLFSVSDKIRRSIIFCMKSYHEPFLIALNNKLI